MKKPQLQTASSESEWQNLLDADEIDSEEHAFLRGYEQDAVESFEA